MKNRDYIQRRVPVDLSKIDIRQQWQITFWTLELRTTQERLSRAIREAGPDTGKVASGLRKTRQVSPHAAETWRQNQDF